MPEIAKISDGMIQGAAATDDLDAALKPLMDAAGITSGDTAGVCFSGVDWQLAGPVKRLAMLEDWLLIESMCDETAA